MFMTQVFNFELLQLIFISHVCYWNAEVLIYMSA